MASGERRVHDVPQELSPFQYEKSHENSLGGLRPAVVDLTSRAPRYAIVEPALDNVSARGRIRNYAFANSLRHVASATGTTEIDPSRSSTAYFI